MVKACLVIEQTHLISVSLNLFITQKFIREDI